MTVVPPVFLCFSFSFYSSIFNWRGARIAKESSETTEVLKITDLVSHFHRFSQLCFSYSMSQQSCVEASLTAALCHQLWRVLFITFNPYDKTSLQTLENTHTAFSDVLKFQVVFGKIFSWRNEMPDLKRERTMSICLWQTDSQCCLKCKLCC